jgi:hypothetical protein
MRLNERPSMAVERPELDGDHQRSIGRGVGDRERA